MRSAIALPASPPTTAPTAAPATVPTGPATDPAAAPAAAPPAAAPMPVPTGCDPGAPVIGSRFASRVLSRSFMLCPPKWVSEDANRAIFGPMKITGIDTCVLTVPPSKQMALEFPHHRLVVAEIATDEGLK